MPPINPTAEQLANRADPTPVTVPLPTEGATFRATGDTQGDAVYQIKNGQLTTIAAPTYIANTAFRDNATGISYKAGDVAPNPRDVTWLDPNYRGTATSRVSAYETYKNTAGSDASALPEFNMADLQGILAKNGGKLPAGTSTTVNGADVKANTSAQLAVAPYLPGGSQSAGLYPAHTDTVVPNTPGGTATNLYDYYASQGKSLPAVADRATLYQTLGLGTATDYKGSATQNEALLQALQLKDHAGQTMGGTSGSAGAASAPGVYPPGSAGNGGPSGGSADNNRTAAGTALAAALAGTDANSTIQNYKTYLASALGVAQTAEDNADSSLSSFYSTRKSSEQILQEELDRRGITSQQSLLSDLDKEISTQTKLLQDLPDNIRTTLQDVGVSQAQLERLQVAEAKKPTQLLNDLLTKRGALASDINTAVGWAEKFADTRIADQAAKLSALQWEVQNTQGQYKDLSTAAQNILLKSIDDRKSIMDTALKAAGNGASSATIDKILSASTGEDAIRAAGSSLVDKSKTSATTLLTADLKDAGDALEVGIPAKGYSGRGPDGYADPNLYIALYNQAVGLYGSAGAAAFVEKHPPAKDLNPVNIGRADLPPVVSNALQAGQKKNIQIDSATINSALDNSGAN